MGNVLVCHPSSTQLTWIEVEDRVTPSFAARTALQLHTRRGTGLLQQMTFLALQLPSCSFPSSTISAIQFWTVSQSKPSDQTGYL